MLLFVCFIYRLQMVFFCLPIPVLSDLSNRVAKIFHEMHEKQKLKMKRYGSSYAIVLKTHFLHLKYILS